MKKEKKGKIGVILLRVLGAGVILFISDSLQTEDARVAPRVFNDAVRSHPFEKSSVEMKLSQMHKFARLFASSSVVCASALFFLLSAVVARGQGDGSARMRAIKPFIGYEETFQWSDVPEILAAGAQEGAGEHRRRLRAHLLRPAVEAVRKMRDH